MSKNLVKLSAMALLVCSVGFVSACGGDDENNSNNANNTNNTNNTTNNVNECPAGQVKATVDGTEACRKDCSTDETVCGATEMCATAGDAKVCVAKPAAECEEGKVKVGDACLVDCSADANVCQATEECVEDGTAKVCKTKAVDPPMDKTAPKCTDATPPARCAADQATFTDWQPASVISAFAVCDPNVEACGFDYNGVAGPDNGLGDTLSIMDGLIDQVNDGISGSIEEGSLALVLEHDGVDLAADGAFSVYFLLGEPQNGLTAPSVEGGNEYKINPASFEMGTYAQAAALGELKGGNVTAGPGIVTLSIALFGTSLNLAITSAQISATVDAANTSADKGVALKDGQLGGVIRVSSVFDALNQFSGTNCACVTGLTNGKLIDYDVNDLAAATCVAGVDASACDSNDQTQGICKTLVDDACGFVGTIAAIAPDVNADNLGKDCLEPALGIECNAISVGAKFTAVGAKITGVVEAAPGE